MAKDSDDDIQSVADEVIEYLANNPNAVDSLEGITTWWLGQQRYLSALNTVQHALDMLVSSGKVIKSSTSDNREVYSLRLTKEE